MLRLFLSIVAAALLCACSPRNDYRQCAGAVWATEFHITYASPSSLDDSILCVFKSVEQSLSPFTHSSVVSRINRGESLEADSLFVVVFEKSKAINRISGGLFDPTVAPLVNLWGFGYTGDIARQPDSVAIDSALAFVGISGCGIAPDGAVIKKSPHTQFNFSAITKGYGCDLVARMLRRNGVSDYMVEIGGEIALSGKNPKDEPWHLQIDAPLENSVPGQNAAAVIAVTDCGVATSGNYRNFKTLPSGKVWHTINPLTGYPAETDMLSATVIAPDCMTADALATACMAMSLRQARAMIEAAGAGVSALFVVGRPGGTPHIVTTSRFPPLL